MADEDISLRDQRDAIMQRVRVGLTGLAAVFLLTLLAASIFSLLGQDEQHGARFANGATVANVASVDDLPREPLAELGIAPGGNLPKTPKAAPEARPAPAPVAPPRTEPGHSDAGVIPHN